jgi:23S rRNA pseudouridine1911/1915/1917 synthase
MKIQARTDGTLFDLLQGRLPDASKTTLRKMLKHERVTIDGLIARRADAPLKAGQIVSISSGREVTMRPPGKILLRDKYLLAVEKPVGILSVARDPADDDTFYRRLSDYVRKTSEGREKIFIVHRLDREVSGLMLFALSPQIQDRLQRAWASTEKRYWALVEGHPPEEEGTVRSWLRENRAHRVYSVPEGPEAKLAVTHYRVRRRGNKLSLLEVRIETGRKNQIRVQLSDLHCPVVGDRKYGAHTDPIHRVGLHAFLLIFTHPVSGERIRLRLPIPGAFRVE